MFVLCLVVGALYRFLCEFYWWRRVFCGNGRVAGWLCTLYVNLPKSLIWFPLGGVCVLWFAWYHFVIGLFYFAALVSLLAVLTGIISEGGVVMNLIVF